MNLIIHPQRLKDNKVNELPKVSEEQIQGQDNRKHITEKGGTNQITKAKEKGINQKINSQDDEKRMIFLLIQ